MHSKEVIMTKEFIKDEKLIYCKYVVINATNELIKEAANIIRQLDGAFMSKETGFVGIIYYSDDKKFLKSIHAVDHVIDDYRLRQIK